MTKHAPSSAELESAVIDILGESKTNMPAKAVRTALVAKHPNWKMPAERRIAKFVKRQNSRVEKKQRGVASPSKSGILGKFFKSDRNSNHSTNTTNTNIKAIGNASTTSTGSGNQIAKQLEQPQQVSPRKSIRQASVSMLKALSPMAKNKKSNQGIPVTKSSMSDLFKKSKVATDAAGPISYQTAEAERSSSTQAVENNHSAEPPTKSVIENATDEEQVKGMDEKQVSLEKEAAADPSDILSKGGVAADVYMDDNDGRLNNNCHCEACIIL